MDGSNYWMPETFVEKKLHIKMEFSDSRNRAPPARFAHDWARPNWQEMRVWYQTESRQDAQKSSTNEPDRIAPQVGSLNRLQELRALRRRHFG
jgi:hypothetical protein